MIELWDKIVGFLQEYTMDETLKAIHALEWREILSNPIFWVISVPLLAFLALRKMIRTIVLIVSLVLFIVLVQNTLIPQENAGIALPNLLLFVGGITGLILLNAYFTFIYQD